MTPPSQEENPPPEPCGAAEPRGQRMELDNLGGGGKEGAPLPSMALTKGTAR